MNYKKLGLLSFAIILTIGLYSCGSEKKEDQNTNSEEFDQAESDLKEQIQEMPIKYKILKKYPSEPFTKTILVTFGLVQKTDSIHMIQKIKSTKDITPKMD